MSAFFGSVVETLVNAMDGMFFSSSVFPWLLAAAAAAGLIFLGMTANSAYELSTGRTFHSFASSLPLAYLFMLHREAIHPGKNVYAFVTLAKKGMDFAPGDPSTWSGTFILFLILLVVCTLFGLMLAVRPSYRQLLLFLGMELAWAVFFRMLSFLEGIFLVGGLINFALDVLMFFGTPVGVLVSIVYMFSAPGDDLSMEQRMEDNRRYNFRVLSEDLPRTLRLPGGATVHKYVNHADNSVTYYYDNNRRAFSVGQGDLRREGDGSSSLVLKINENDEERTMIPLNVSVREMKVLKRD